MLGTPHGWSLSVGGKVVLYKPETQQSPGHKRISKTKTNQAPSQKQCNVTERFQVKESHSPIYIIDISLISL